MNTLGSRTTSGGEERWPPFDDVGAEAGEARGREEAGGGGGRPRKGARAPQRLQGTERRRRARENFS